MQINKLMSNQANIISSSTTITEAAAIMRDKDIGALPVYRDDRLVGMVTDRDIVIRGVSQRLSPDSPVEQVMSNRVLYCFDDQSAEDVIDNMADQKIRRLPVLSRDKRIVGLVAFSDLASGCGSDRVKNAMSKITAAGR